jgi:hypothetical protein
MTTNRLVKMPRPFPSAAAQSGLTKIKGLEVSFTARTTKAEQAAALEHLDELIDWWHIPSRQWNRASVTNSDTPHRKRRRGSR